MAEKQMPNINEERSKIALDLSEALGDKMREEIDRTLDLAGIISGDTRALTALNIGACLTVTGLEMIRTTFGQIGLALTTDQLTKLAGLMIESADKGTQKPVHEYLREAGVRIP